MGPRNSLYDSDVDGNTFMWMQDQERERQEKVEEDLEEDRE